MSDADPTAPGPASAARSDDAHSHDARADQTRANDAAAHVPAQLQNDVRRAARLLSEGRLVAFPTETVYGLGADATNADAVAMIFAAKGRPATNPLIVHVASTELARRYAGDWPPIADQLAEAFWPGPLTLVLPRHASITPAVSAGVKTVGIRVPSHPIALAMLRAFDGPVAAPSANRSNHVSPTTAEHVRQEFGDTLAMILDGGACDVGIESTVLDLTRTVPTILRPGGISRSSLAQLLGRVDLLGEPSADPEGNEPPDRSAGGPPGDGIGAAGQRSAGSAISPATPAASPGLQARHYAPNTPAYRVPHGSLPTASDAGTGVLPIAGSPAEYARSFYATLRELDRSGYRTLLLELPPDHPDWAAVRDRLVRATLPLPG